MQLQKVGVGLRNPHLFYFANNPVDVPLFEVHPENFFNMNSWEYELLKRIAETNLISLHGVGLSLGSVDGLNKDHLKKLKQLNKELKPQLISEHLSWSEHGGKFYNDLIAFPYTDDAMQIICDNINEYQDEISRKILIENPSSYVSFKESKYSEADFMNRICEKTGCGILLDVNNIYVSSQNVGSNSMDYLKEINDNFVEEIHIAGHEVNNVQGEEVLIDTHSRVPRMEVINLLKEFLKNGKQVDIILEWDKDIPEPLELLKEAERIEGEINEL